MITINTLWTKFLKCHHFFIGLAETKWLLQILLCPLVCLQWRENVIFPNSAPFSFLLHFTFMSLLIFWFLYNKVNWMQLDLLTWDESVDKPQCLSNLETPRQISCELQYTSLTGDKVHNFFWFSKWYMV